MSCDKVLSALHVPDSLKVLQSYITLGSGINAQKVLFIMVFMAVLFGCINGSREIVKEAAIYRRERTVNLGLLPYMLSKVAVLGILCLFQSAVLLLLVDIGEPLHQGIFLPIALETYITLTLTALAGLMLGLTISTIAKNNDQAISFVPLILIPQILFAGALIPIQGWPTQILAVLFPTRWAMAALSSSIGVHNDKVVVDMSSSGKASGDMLFGNDYTSHGTLYSIYSHSEAVQRLLLCWGMLLLLIVVMLIIIGIFLKRKDIRR